MITEENFQLAQDKYNFVKEFMVDNATQIILRNKENLDKESIELLLNGIFDKGFTWGVMLSQNYGRNATLSQELFFDRYDFHDKELHIIFNKK